ncbi:hypothetical protein B9Z19DRAFT_1129406 [Tuber borchii]|uniref:Uncharacterized protein n=1 Tax=Tuber borchii TaxID=42251 RepID=A0A2T6ZME4_TUBBO|nr:hypothetical protein B9Z19DRAFT_1129406 [Tuber borchii]
MPCRRGSTCRADTTETWSRSSTAGIRKNTRNRRAPQRYGNQSDEEASQPGSAETVILESEGETIIPGQPDGRAQLEITPETESLRYNTSRTASAHSETHLDAPESSPYQPSSPGGTTAITINDVRNLLDSHANNIVDQVVLKLRPEVTNRNSNPIANPATHRPSRQPANNLQTDPTLQYIRDLEDQISQLHTGRI